MRSRTFDTPRRRFATLLFSTLPVWLSPSLALAQSPGGTTGGGDPEGPNVIVITASPAVDEESAVRNERGAANLARVLAREEITRYPDTELGSAIKRLPGVGLQYNAGTGLYTSVRGIDPNLVGVTFGGVRLAATDPLGRHLSLNQITPNLVSQVVLTLANTPDQDAEALGGTIELTPRSAFDVFPRPTLEGHVGSGIEPARPKYGIIDGEITFGATFGFGPRGNPFASSPAPRVLTPDGKDGGKGAAVPSAAGKDGPDADAGGSVNPADRPFGLLGTFDYYEDHRGADTLLGVYDNSSPASSSNKILRELDFYRSTFNRQLFGYGGTLDFRPSDALRLYVTYADSGYREAAIRNGLVVTGLNSANDGAGNPVPDPQHAGYDLANRAALQSSLRYKEDQHFDNQVVSGGGRFHRGPLTVDFRGAFAQAVGYDPLEITANFNTPADEVVAYKNNGTANQPSVLLRGAPTNPDPFDPTRYKFGTLTVDRNGGTDTEFSGAASATLQHAVFGFPAAAKFGGGVRLRTKHRYDVPQTFSAFNGEQPFTLADVTRGVLKTDYDGRYPLGFSPDLGLLTRFIDRNRAGFVQNLQADRVTSLQAFFDDSENIYAGFGQYDVTLFNRLNLLAGARVEATSARYGAYANAPGTDPRSPDAYRFTERTNDYLKVFPTVQARYDFTAGLLARFSYSTAIGRPTFGQVTASTIVNQVNRTIVTGNAALEPTTDQSFDLALDWQPAPGARVSVGGFDKEFQNYIFQRTLNQTIDGVNYLTSTFQNAGDAYARGIEVDVEQKFVFLPRPFRGLGIEANYTYVDSQGSARPGDRVKLPYTAPNLYNAALFYEDYGLRVSLAASYTDRNLQAVGTARGTDRYFDEHFNLDLAASYLHRRGLGVYFHAKNLTNAPLRVFEGNRERPVQREYYGETYEFGVQFKFF